MKENLNGFIINTRRADDNSFFMLHKSNCFHITEYDGFDDMAYTGRDWIKIASNDLSDLFSECQAQKAIFEWQIKVCKSCFKK